MSDLQEKSYQLPENTPEKAPVPNFDPNEANYFDMFAPQYYNLETVQALMQEGGGPLLLEVDRVGVEYVYNPEHGEDSGDWKPVVHFYGGGPALVINQTRAKTLMKAAGSIHVEDWHRAGWLEVSAGIESGQAQILIAPSSAQLGLERAELEGVVDDLDDELFG